MTEVVSTLLWEDQISRFGMKNFRCSRGWYENDRFLTQDALYHGRNWARLLFSNSLKTETVSFSRTLLAYYTASRPFFIFFFFRGKLSVTLLPVSGQSCENFAQKYKLASLTNVACDSFRHNIWKYVIINCNRGLRKCISLLWRVRNFPSPGAASIHTTALSNVEGTFQLHDVFLLKCNLVIALGPYNLCLPWNHN
jgi:hypothetical protein